MAAQKLTVGGLPDNAFSFTNFVYALDASSLSSTGYVTVNGFAFRIRSNPNVQAGMIAMGSMQRKLAKTDRGQMAEVKAHDLQKSSPLFAMTLRVDLKSKRQGSLHEDDFADDFRQKFMGMVFYEDQQLPMEHNGLTVVVTMGMLKAYGDSSDVATITDSGLLDENTNLALDVVPNKLLSVTKSENASRGQMLNKQWNFKALGIGGLDKEFAKIFRRAFASRLFPQKILKQLGIKHTKGMLLYGPPGTGKTLIARQIGKLLDGHEPKVVNGPEVLNKFVGQSEENIRNLFKDAEDEYAEKGDESKLHIIIFDEIDAICKQRGSVRSGTGVNDTVVNQLLSKIDGVNSPNNILVIGMTNRKDLIDEAIIRPGRLEVHVEISLPDKRGREDIFYIHTNSMRENGRLGDDVDLAELAANTKNYSGAEIEGVVKSASSFALYGTVDVNKINEADFKMDNVKDVRVQMHHFLKALEEVKPSFGKNDEDLEACLRGGMIMYGNPVKQLIETGHTLIKQVIESERTPLLSLLLEGAVGSGATALAAHLASTSEIPFVRLISAEQLIGYSDTGKAHRINQIFEDAYKSKISLLIVDNIERLLDYVPVGQRFSNQVLQALLVLLKKVPPVADRKMMIIATTSQPRVLEQMQVMDCFNVILRVPQVSSSEEVRTVITELECKVSDDQLDLIAANTPFPVGIKDLLMLVEMARQLDDEGMLTFKAFSECLESTKIDRKTIRANMEFDTE